MLFHSRRLLNGYLNELLYERTSSSRPLPAVNASSLIDARVKAADQAPDSVDRPYPMSCGTLASTSGQDGQPSRNRSARVQGRPDASGRLLLLGALCLTLAACAGPVRAVRVDQRAAQRDLTRSVVTTGELSWATRDVLLERGLEDTFHDRPEVAITELHRAMVDAQGEQDLLFALAESSFLYGQAAKKPEYQMAAAIYAYAFLFPEDGPRLGPFDPRFRSAADLYNSSLTAAFASKDGSEVVPRGGTFALPFGQITVGFDAAELRAGSRELQHFVPLDQLKVEGLAMRYRRPGIGAPLGAATIPIAGENDGGDMVAPRLKVPLTALLRIPDARRALVEGQTIAATLELHLAWDADTVSIAGERVPLEREPTAALALTFTGVPIMEVELFGYLGRLSGILADRPPLISTTPYRPGLVPVVFVHGTASSVVRWAEMLNRLQADPDIRSRYQFWFFQYDSDNPVALSAHSLRDALEGAVARLDPDGKDPALRRMVLIGHSQGGLLVKMQSISSGDRIWNAISSKPLDQLRLSDSTRELFRRALFVEPLPEVARVVFISTPHRGSFVAGYQIIANVARKLTILPFRLTGVAADLARNLDAVRNPFVPTATDNMSPRSPFIQGLQQVPISPAIKVNSIISVEAKYWPDGSFNAEEGNDGVVAYSSAHIEPVESEMVVRSPHSCQGNPHTIEEVRRILRLHVGLGTSDGPLETEDTRSRGAGDM
jgi:pimeloyl-ACP methyl ester carboxylesterase